MEIHLGVHQIMSVPFAMYATKAENGMTQDQADAITANTAKVGITTAQADAITANTAKVGITNNQAAAITANTAKVGITTAQADAITANTAKVGITNNQAAAITANTAKVAGASATEIGYLAGVTSSIQTQINNLSGGGSASNINSLSDAKVTIQTVLFILEIFLQIQLEKIIRR